MSRTRASSVFERERVRQQDLNDALLNRHQGNENPMTIWREMGQLMTANVTVTRYNEILKKTLGQLDELSERFKRINLSDRTQWANQTLNFVRELGNMLVLAKVITLGALARNESRGAHWKPEFPNRDDKNWLKTTKASYQAGKSSSSTRRWIFRCWRRGRENTQRKREATTKAKILETTDEH